jgi:hypothetical protein
MPKRRFHGERSMHEALSGHQRSEPTHPELRFRVLLTEGDTQVFFHCEAVGVPR